MATFCLAEALAGLGHDVDVLTSGRLGDRPIEIIRGFTVYRAMSLRKGVHDCGLQGAATYMGFALPKLNTLIRNGRYDIFHYFFSLPTGLFTLLPGGRYGKPYVVSLRGSDVPGYDPFNTTLAFLHNLLKPVTRRIWNRSKHVVAVTRSLKKVARETAPDQKIEVIPNGVDTDLFKPSRGVPKDRSCFELICVSRLVKRKGIDHILSAMAGLRSENIKLSIVGTGNYENILKRQCRDLSLNSAVAFKGFRPREKLPELYAQSDAFILTSRSEAFGNVFAEAMSCGLPVIGANVGGIPDLVTEKTGILVEPGDIDSIKKAILRLKHSQGLRAQMGQASRTLILKNHRWSQIAERFLELYVS
ncbi:MAG: glycosyltransferase [Desulfosarcina sp.]|nr:glycosyltransferase [Desulfobacterales bacterium]